MLGALELGDSAGAQRWHGTYEAALLLCLEVREATGRGLVADNARSCLALTDEAGRLAAELSATPETVAALGERPGDEAFLRTLGVGAARECHRWAEKAAKERSEREPERLRLLWEVTRGA